MLAPLAPPLMLDSELFAWLVLLEVADVAVVLVSVLVGVVVPEAAKAGAAASKAAATASENV